MGVDDALPAKKSDQQPVVRLATITVWSQSVDVSCSGVPLEDRLLVVPPAQPGDGRLPRRAIRWRLTTAQRRRAACSPSRAPESAYVRIQTNEVTT
ncbi:hypothetical protein [Streptosporangium minutum]|uniref:hypothetical protein n=1 Tax=Streptosporangium minutum TaxID=569862 RepID=UPI001056DD25|nr:hypothetical protein [Streptosporangium minutum]